MLKVPLHLNVGVEIADPPRRAPSKLLEIGEYERGVPAPAIPSVARDHLWKSEEIAEGLWSSGAACRTTMA